MKYVLIHWVASNEISILTENFVRDKSMLDKPEEEGMVVFGDSRKKPPKSGWKSYLGRVLATSDSKNALMKKEQEFLLGDNQDEDEDEVPMKRQCLEMDDTQRQENYKDKKKLSPNKVRKAAEKKAYKRVFQKIAVDSDSDSDADSDPEEIDEPTEGQGSHSLDCLEQLREANSCSSNCAQSINKLEKQVAGLRKDLVTLHRKIPDLIRQALSSSLSETKENKKRPFATTMTNTFVTPKRTPLSPSTQQPCAQASSKPASAPPRLSSIAANGSTFDEDIATHSSASLSDYLDSVQISEVMRSPNHKKMTAYLMMALFERNVMASSSVTGKSQEGRSPLDRVKVELIIDCVLKKYPDVNEYMIKSVMAQKCKDQRFAIEGRRRKSEQAK